MTATVLIARTTPKTVDAVVVPVATTGAVPRSLGLARAALAAIGFEGKPGQTVVEATTVGPSEAEPPPPVDPQAVRTAAPTRPATARAPTLARRGGRGLSLIHI